MDASRELADFLRSRRERLDPTEVGLPVRRRRRTPGLRREEVAELARVSVDYVIRLEQGRGTRPSPEVLESLSQALRLNDDERAHLFDLASHRLPTRRRPASETAPPILERLVHALSPQPALLLSHRFDILAWNPEMAALMVDFGSLPPQQRNTLFLCFLHPAMRDFYIDREPVVREAIADLRAAWAAHPDDQGLTGLVGELALQSEEFARYWARRDVKVSGQGQKRLRHPKVGSLTVDFQVLTPLQETGQRLIVYQAADAPSQAALDAIAHEAAATGPALHVV